MYWILKRFCHLNEICKNKYRNHFDCVCPRFTLCVSKFDFLSYDFGFNRIFIFIIGRTRQVVRWKMSLQFDVICLATTARYRIRWLSWKIKCWNLKKYFGQNRKFLYRYGKMGLSDHEKTNYFYLRFQGKGFNSVMGLFRL